MYNVKEDSIPTKLNNRNNDSFIFIFVNNT